MEWKYFRERWWRYQGTCEVEERKYHFKDYSIFIALVLLEVCTIIIEYLLNYISFFNYPENPLVLCFRKTTYSSCKM